MSRQRRKTLVKCLKNRYIRIGSMYASSISFLGFSQFQFSYVSTRDDINFIVTQHVGLILIDSFDSTQEAMGSLQ